MALSIQSIARGGTSDPSLTIQSEPQTHAPGTALLMFARWDTTDATPVSLVNTGDDTWFDVSDPQTGDGDSGTYVAQIAWNINGAVDDVIELTFDAPVAYGAIIIYEINGSFTTNPIVDWKFASDGNNDSNPLFTTDELTIPSQSIIVSFILGVNQVISGEDGYSFTQWNLSGDDQGQYFADEWMIVSSNTAATATGTGYRPWCMFTVAVAETPADAGTLFEQDLDPGMFSFVGFPLDVGTDTDFYNLDPGDFSLQVKDATFGVIIQASNNQQVTLDSYRIEWELVGAGNGWTKVFDVRGDEPLTFGYGIRGTLITDRVGSSGKMQFTLDNSQSNSTRTLALYSPEHDSALPGFDIGIGVRLILVYRGVEYCKWQGALDVIQPESGRWDARRVFCTAVDFMDDCARNKVTGIAIQLGKTSSQIFSTLVAAMPRQPAAVQVEAGQDLYPYALDNITDENTTFLQAFNKLAISEFGYIYLKGGVGTGGVLAFESRAHRANSVDNLSTIVSAKALSVSRSRSNIYNQVKVTPHPRRVDPTNTSILFVMSSVLSVDPGTTFGVTCPYRSPQTGQFARAGAADMIPPVPYTDYILNLAEDGSGLDVTMTVPITAVFGSNSAVVTFNTLTSTSRVYIRYFQLRGRGIYDFESISMVADDIDSQQRYGVNTLSIDQPFQNDQRVSLEIAQYALHMGSVPKNQLPAIPFLATANDRNMHAFLTREISDRVGVIEQVTGLKESTGGGVTRGYFINSVDGEIVAGSGGRVINATWGCIAADPIAYWILDDPELSVLDHTTIPAYGQLLGHIDVDHVDAHNDFHTDFHTDTNHGDAAPISSPHSDGTHGDAGHTDVVHADTDHTDIHGDIPHEDSHGDVIHVDNHSDRAAYGTGSGDDHIDVAHADSHGDVAGDKTHNDELFTDVHGDTPHDDIEHVDSTHTDSIHGDAAHVDTAHSDSPHLDTHTDTHSDVHDDSLHGDV